MPKFSVIIPTFNRAKYVQLAINSVLQQTYRDFEIIVVDDGSKDDTARAVSGLTGPIKYIYQENRGVSSARNRGIREAVGEWIAFLDSDDEWEPDYLARQVGLATKYPSIVSSSLNSVEFSKDGTSSINKFLENGLFGHESKRKDFMVEVPLDVVISHDITILDSCVFRREKMMKTRLFDEQLTIGEDLDVVMQMALQGPFSFSVELGTKIFRREEPTPSLSAQIHTTGISARLCWARVFERILNDFKLTDHQTRVLNFRYSRNQRSLGNLLLRIGEINQAREAYRQSLQLWPSWPPRIRLIFSYLPFGLGTLFLYRDRNVKPSIRPNTKTPWKQDTRTTPPWRKS